ISAPEYRGSVNIQTHTHTHTRTHAHTHTHTLTHTLILSSFPSFSHLFTPCYSSSPLSLMSLFPLIFLSSSLLFSLSFPAVGCETQTHGGLAPRLRPAVLTPS